MFTQDTKSLIVRFVLTFAFVIGLLGFQPVKPVHAATNWYVAATGNDSNSCFSPDFPCLTINVALGKATSGETIYISEGIYTYSTGNAVIQVSKNIILSGGWDNTFSSQIGFAVIDGQQTHQGIRVDSSITVTIDRFIVENGYASTGGGINSYGNLTINRSIIRRNTSTSHGAGIYKNNTLAIYESSIYENTGVGIYSLGGNLNVSNTTISQNSGTGVYVNFSGLVTINNSTITSNISTLGGGVYNYYSDTQVYLNNSIVANNIATGYYPPLPGNMQDCHGTLISSGNNIIKTPTGSCSIVGGVSDQIGVDPQLSDFLPSKGFQPLTANSPAVNAGDPATCLPTDQREIVRDSACDIGAYEYTAPGSAAEMLLVSGDNQHAEIGRPFSLSLKVAIVDDFGAIIPNVAVTFTAPATNASGTFADTHSYSTTILTDATGVATSPIFSANNVRGNYIVTVSAAGLGSTIKFNLENLAWFVAPDGSDANTCTSPEEPCGTINSAINKAALGDTVYIKTGIYTSGTSPMKDIVLSGGWDESFTTQSGLTTIDGQNTNGGIGILMLV